MPFFFIFNPALLLTGSTVPEYIFAGITACIGGVALAAGIKGYLFRRTFIWERVLLFAVGISLMDTSLLINIISLSILACVVASQLLMKEKVKELPIELAKE